MPPRRGPVWQARMTGLRPGQALDGGRIGGLPVGAPAGRQRAIRSWDRVLAIDSNAGASWLAAVTL